jgi:tetratricopeptide (TPR) repeat protein
VLRKSLMVLAMAAVTPAATAVDPSRQAISYICGAEQTGGGSGPREVKRQEGVGNSRLAIATSNPDAQAWFDYGLQLADGFYHEDAKTAFAKAVELDPACAVCLWGEAWSRSDNLNIPASKDEQEKAKALLAKADKVAANASERDRALIAALKARYEPPKGKSADQAYSEAMDAIAVRYPDEPELAVIAAQGWMMPARRNDRSGIERAIQLLDGVLKRQPDHAGAIHFYIHATEFAGRAAVALPYAQKLPQIAPTASHLVHMPAHTLFRVGRYEEAALLNAQALGVEARYRKVQNAAGPLGGALYYFHNFSFGLGGAMMSGDGDLAVRFAEHAPLAFPMTLSADQRDNAIARSYVAFGRYEPAKAMAIPEPAKDKAAQRLFRHYARGEAAAARGDVSLLRAEQKAAAELDAKGSQLENMQTMVSHVLEGREAMLTGDLRRAARAYSAAAELQDSRLRDMMDPPPWWYPVRRSLAAVLLAQGQYADAAAEARRSLAGWPHDGLALRVLAEAEGKLGHEAEARERLAEARKAYLGDLTRVPLGLI